MGGNLGRKTKTPDPIRSRASKKAAITRRRNRRKKKTEQKQAQERALKGFSIGLSETATLKLFKLARKETGGRAESKALEKLIFGKGGGFTRAVPHAFRISKDAYKALQELEMRYKLSAETIVEKLLKKR